MFASPPFLLYSVRTVNSCGKGGGTNKGTRHREDSRHALYSTIFACEFFLAAFSSTTKTRFVRMRGTSSREHFAKLPYGLPSPPTNGPPNLLLRPLITYSFPHQHLLLLTSRANNIDRTRFGHKGSGPNSSRRSGSCRCLCGRRPRGCHCRCRVGCHEGVRKPL